MGDTEVGEYGPVVSRGEDVARFDVAVHDAVVVCLGKTGRHLLTDVGGPPYAECALLTEQIPQGRPLNQFHDDPRTSVLLGHVEHGDDRGVAELRGASCFPEHAGPQNFDLVGGQVRRGGQLLDRDRAVEQGVGASPNTAHTTGADDVVQAIPVDQDATGVVFRTVHVCAKSSAGG